MNSSDKQSQRKGIKDPFSAITKSRPFWKLGPNLKFYPGNGFDQLLVDFQMSEEETRSSVNSIFEFLEHREITQDEGLVWLIYSDETFRLASETSGLASKSNLEFIIACLPNKKVCFSSPERLKRNLIARPSHMPSLHLFFEMMATALCHPQLQQKIDPTSLWNEYIQKKAADLVSQFNEVNTKLH